MRETLKRERERERENSIRMGRILKRTQVL
jgi:hypothetical protein